MPKPDPTEPAPPIAEQPRRGAAGGLWLLPALAVACLLFGPSSRASGPGLVGPGSPATPVAHSLADLGDGLGLTEAEVEALEAGEPVVHPPDAEAPPEAAAGLAYRVLPAPAERAFRAVADWHHYAEFFPFVLESRVLAEASDVGLPGTLVEQRVDLPFPFPDRRFTLRTGWRCCSAGERKLPYEVTWSHVEGTGNIAAQEGRWRLWPLAAGGVEEPDRTLVELRLLSDAGAGIPDGLERRALLETLPWALDGLRQQVRRCRYDLPIHPSCGERPPHAAADSSHPAYAVPESLR